MYPEAMQVQSGQLKGHILAPPSKSISHRMLIMAALSGAGSRVCNVLHSDDTSLTMDGLAVLNYPYSHHADCVEFLPRPAGDNSACELFVGESGTTARFLTALAAAQTREVYIHGAGRMHERPMLPLLEALQALGKRVEHNEGCLPVRLGPEPLRGGTLAIDSSFSSQFMSALLILAPLVEGGLRIRSRGPIASRPYLDMTLSLMRRAGIRSTGDTEAGEYVIAGGQRYRLSTVQVEGDYSNAAYLLAGAALSGGELCISNLPRHSCQGDAAIVDILRAMGVNVTVEQDSVCIMGSAALRACERDMYHCPDLVPTVAVLALFADGVSRLRRVGHLRYKESDRLSAIVENIASLGSHAAVAGDDLIIEPAPLHAALIDSHGDHRIAMAFALAGLNVPGVCIDRPSCVGKSYPEFWNDMARLGRPRPEGEAAFPAVPPQRRELRQ